MPEDAMRVVAILSFPLMVFLFLIIWISVTLRHRNRVVVAMRFMGMTLNITADQDKHQPRTRQTDPEVLSRQPERSETDSKE